jgi:Ca-activated chloride channel family protein
LLPSSDEEVWVIARSSDVERPDREDRPGSGSLWTRVEEREVAVPLKHTDVHASIDGYIATVSVTQEFHNPYAGKIEASYVFPLPENAAVNEFVMTIGPRRIRGIIRERQQAEEIYRDARRQGYTASLLTQERPNVFVQSVANIEPGREIDVTLKYFHTLACVDGWFDFVFPMVVGPRFNPPGTSQGVGAAGRGHRGVSGQGTEVSYLAPPERSGHDISLEVDVRPGMAIEELTCPSHRTEVEKAAPEHQRVRLSPGDALPNKDFVLRFRLDGAELKSSLLVHRDERGGFFSLMLMPPRVLQARTRQPVEMIFVLDSSGSMNGRPIEQAKAAIGRGLELLSEDDTFQLIDFSEHASQFGPSPLPATPYQVARARRYLARLQGSGGTMMLNGIKAALNFPHDPDRLRFVCFLTDGYIGNEAEILREVQRRLGDARIFSFGVGTSPNRYLLNSMARLGRGAVAYLAHDGDPVRTMDTFFESVSHPALTDLRIDWGGLEAREVFPRRIPDLFAGRPVLLTGRCRGRVQEMVRVSGKVGRQRMQLEIPVDLADHADGSRAFPSVWARMKIADLADEAALGGNGLRAATVRQLALDYQLMSAYTAFVAVDARERTAGRMGTTVPVPVPVPEGVHYDTTVEE